MYFSVSFFNILDILKKIYAIDEQYKKCTKKYL